MKKGRCLHLNILSSVFLDVDDGILYLLFSAFVFDKIVVAGRLGLIKHDSSVSALSLGFIIAISLIA